MIPIAKESDLDYCEEWQFIADWFIFDAKVLEGNQPGGTGHQFDWTILTNYRGHIPWMLAGGLDSDNVARAIKISGARAVDVSSGVENVIGKKDENKINNFIRAAKID